MGIIWGMARPRKFVEAEVVEASRDLFWDQGYAATSIDDLSAATGLGRGSFYKAFGDKHSMFLRSLELYCTEAIDGIRAELRNPDRSAYERLVGHVRNTAAGVASDTDRRGCLLAKSAAELSSTDPVVAKQVKRTLDGWLRELTATISAAQADGDPVGHRRQGGGQPAAGRAAWDGGTAHGWGIRGDDQVGGRTGHRAARGAGSRRRLDSLGHRSTDIVLVNFRASRRQPVRRKGHRSFVSGTSKQDSTLREREPIISSALRWTIVRPPMMDHACPPERSCQVPRASTMVAMRSSSTVPLSMVLR